MLNTIFERVLNNLKNPKLYILIFVLILLFLLLFPYLDANIFYFNRVSQRIAILNSISQIDIEKLKNNDVLINEYNNIILEIEKQKTGSLGNIFISEKDNLVNTFKFIAGGLLFWIFAIMCIFIKTFKRKFHKFIAIILCGISGILVGWVSSIIPTVINPWVNCILFPFLIILLIIILVTSATKSKKEE